MKIKPITTDKDNQSALEEIDRLFDALPGTPEGDRLEVLVALVVTYETQRYPTLDPARAFAQETMTHTAKLKTNDRRAVGYYCQVEGKHFLILDDAELINSDLANDWVITGFVEIDPETLREQATLL